MLYLPLFINTTQFIFIHWKTFVFVTKYKIFLYLSWLVCHFIENLLLLKVLFLLLSIFFVSCIKCVPFGVSLESLLNRKFSLCIFVFILFIFLYRTTFFEDLIFPNSIFDTFVKYRHIFIIRGPKCPSQIRCFTKFHRSVRKILNILIFILLLILHLNQILDIINCTVL